jgi:hypothetical protein
VICDFRWPDGQKCSSTEFEHVHASRLNLPCRNGRPERHHEFVAPKPHEHVYDRCLCGKRAEVMA